ncbi:MAG: hypothetical protein ACFFDN_37125, partial [Candidatus Hodarchaeota archaeon]
IMIAFIISAIFIFLFFIFRKKEIKKGCLIAFIAFSFAFNIVVVQEYLFHVNHPDPGEAMLEAAEFHRERIELIEKPVYSNNGGMLSHLNKYWLTDDQYLNVGIYGESVRYSKEGIVDEGTIFLLDVPFTPRDSELWRWANTCDLIKEFKSKGKTFVYVFECKNDI